MADAAVSTITEIEDAIICALEDAKCFEMVASFGREGTPPAPRFPAALVYFAGDSDTGNLPRPVFMTRFDVLVSSRNLSSEESAKRDAYQLLDAARDAILGKTLGLVGVGPFGMAGREFIRYGGGVATYALRFQARAFLPVPID